MPDGRYHCVDCDFQSSSRQSVSSHWWRNHTSNGKTHNVGVSYPEGKVAWNKGLKGIHLSPKSEFKKGQFTGSQHPSWKGGEQINANDCVYIYAGANKRIRRPRKVYEDAHGEIPKGWILYHIDKDMHNDSLDNLIAIPRAVLVMLNANRINGNYQEIKSAVENYKNKNKIIL
jgi:hypothetical protein